MIYFANTVYSWLLIILSALLYPIPFIFNHYAWWTIFLFPIPLFYTALTSMLSFKHGFIWGFLAFSIHLSGICYAIALGAHGPWIFRLMPFIIILLYFSLCAGFTFYFAQLYCKKISFLTNHQIAPLLLWCTALTIFFVFISTLCLTPFGFQEGYCLADILLPLACEPKLLHMLSYVSHSFCTFLLLLIPATAAYAIYKKTVLSLIFLCCAVTPWYACLKKTNVPTLFPSWLSSVYCLPYMTFSHAESPQSALLSITQECKTIIAKYPYIDIIVMPESACNSTKLFENQHLFDCFDEHTIGKAIHLIFGSCTYKNKNLYNSMYWIHNGKIKKIFKKRHTILLRERIPNYSCFSFLHSIYLHTTQQTKRSKNERPQLHISSDIVVVPYICSEFFCNYYPDDNHPDSMLLVLANDSDFITPHIPSYVHILMQLHTQLKAVLWKRTILYISYFYALYIDKNGKYKQLGEVYNFS